MQRLKPAERAEAPDNGQPVKHKCWPKNTKRQEEVIVINSESMVDGHMVDCAVREEGPCTCGTQEELEALALEDAGLTAEDYE